MFGGKTFNPDTDIADLSGKVIFCTGGNTGLGEESLKRLAKHNPKELFLAARTRSKAEEAIANIKKESPNANITFLELDLTSFASIKAAAEAFQSKSKRLDILLNNAGIMSTPYSKTKDGYEIQFGTNHMGHALLTKLLLPTLLRTAEEPGSDVRVVNLSSEGHRFSGFCGGVIFDQTKAESQYTMARYGSSKLSNILHARGLKKHYPQITSVAVHPGLIHTQLYTAVEAQGIVTRLGTAVGAMFFSGVPQGTKNQLWACTAPKEEVGKAYYFTPVAKKSAGNGYAQDEKLADKLWDWTEKEFKKHGF